MTPSCAKTSSDGSPKRSRRSEQEIPMTTVLTPADFPERFDSVEHLEDFMSTPTRALVDDLARVQGDIIILGVAGKMGVTLARMAKRAAPQKRGGGAARDSQ